MDTLWMTNMVTCKGMFQDCVVPIIAPGPNGEQHWDKIESFPGFKITVNYGINIPIKHDFWMVTDWWALKTEWFINNINIKDNSGISYIFSEGLITKLPEYGFDFDIADYYVKLVDGRDCVKPLGTGTFVDVPGRLRPDGTVAASAVELAVKCGAKEVVLCGVDMEGDRYFDGKESKSIHCDHQGEWCYTPYFNSLIQWAREQGVDVWSLSKTTLDVDVRDV